jgi:hypothetical protein
MSSTLFGYCSDLIRRSNLMIAMKKWKQRSRKREGKNKTKKQKSGVEM